MENKLRRIHVKNLFNRFTYDINLENGYDVAIFIAPNGCGKTTVFSLVNYIFNPSVFENSHIARIPFEKCTCTLSNGKEISLEKRDIKVKKKDEKYFRPPYAVTGVGLGALYDEHKELIVTIDDGEVHEFNLSKEISQMARESFAEDMPDAYTDRMLERMMAEGIDPDEISVKSVRNRARNMRAHNRQVFFAYSEFLAKYDCTLEINFITADRLHKAIPHIKGSDFGYFGRPRGYEARGENDPLGTIQDNFKILYTVTDEKYNRLVSEARDKLPKMYLGKSKKDVPVFEEFEKGWKEYVGDIERFTEIGLMDSSQQILEMGELEKAYDGKGAFLSVYLDVFKSTLNPWREQYERMKLFIDILNRRNRVTMKTLKYSSTGLKLTVDGNELPLDCLSSGEKNDLIMFYNLIFNSEKGGLVLIDEPEISLHIEWQEEYLDCLLNICEMNGLQAIVATHSPNIVNGHFELYAERGLTDERRGN